MASRRSQRTKHELRCFCAREPLLAIFGVDEKGRLYVHQRVYKQGRVFGESLHYGGGTVALLCRECLRWQQVVIKERTKAVLEPMDMPEMFRAKVGPRESLPSDHSDS